MAKQQDFAYYLTNYLTVYLSGTKNFSIHTIHSYRDAFKLLLKYCEEELQLSAGKLRLHMITPEMISGFIQWLKNSRGNSDATANQRLDVIHAFFKYLQSREPQFLLQCQQILAVERARSPKPAVGFLSVT